MSACLSIRLPRPCIRCHQHLLDHPVHPQHVWEATKTGVTEAVKCLLYLLGLLVYFYFVPVPFYFLLSVVGQPVFGKPLLYWLPWVPVVWGFWRYSLRLGQLSGRGPWKVWLPTHLLPLHPILRWLLVALTVLVAGPYVLLTLFYTVVFIIYQLTH